jgi:hypothetical protein
MFEAHSIGRASAFIELGIEWIGGNAPGKDA